MSNLFKRFMKDESGQGLTEYVLIIALVAIGVIAIMVVFRNSIGKLFETASNELENAPGQQYQASGS
jgi:pilus assembly protein Flp/PilA